MPAGELHYATATELLALYARKTLSPVEVAEAVLARIDALNPRLNCFVFVDAERTLREARASESRWQKGAPLGALDGVPVSVKDLLLTEGWPTRKGSLTGPFDVLLGPTMPVLPFKAGRNFPDGWPSNPLAWLPFTPLSNLTRHPAASVNAGFSRGLPIGVQLVGPLYRDRVVFQAAGALERELGLVARRPPL